MRHRLKIPMEPVAKGRPRAVIMVPNDCKDQPCEIIKSKGYSGSKPFIKIYTPKETEEFEARLRDFFRINWKRPVIEAEAIILTLIFYLQRPKSVKRKYPTVKPDMDNYEKAVLDAGNEVVWRDDCLIVDKNTKLRYAAPGAWGYILMELMTHEDEEKERELF